MAIGDESIVDKAARQLRELPETGWYAMVDDVITRVRATPRAGTPILVDDPEPGAAPGVLRVGDLVVSTLITRALAADPDVTVRGVDIDVDENEIASVTVQLAGHYGVDLHSAAARVVTVCAAIITDVIGLRPDIRIDAVVTDLTS